MSPLSLGREGLSLALSIGVCAGAPQTPRQCPSGKRQPAGSLPQPEPQMVPVPVLTLPAPSLGQQSRLLFPIWADDLGDAFQLKCLMTELL